MEIPKQAIYKVVSLNIVKSRQGNFVTIFTEICFDTDDDNLMLRINVDGDDNCNDDADRCVGRHCTNTNTKTNTNCTNKQIHKYIAQIHKYIAQKHKYIAQIHKYSLLLTDAWEGIAHGVLHPGHPLLLRGQQVVLPHLDYNHH